MAEQKMVSANRVFYFMVLFVSISVILIGLGIRNGYNNGRTSYEREIVYCIASESSCTVNNMIISKAADGRNIISFNYKPFDKNWKEKK